MDYKKGKSSGSVDVNLQKHGPEERIPEFFNTWGDLKEY